MENGNRLLTLVLRAALVLAISAAAACDDGSSPHDADDAGGDGGRARGERFSFFVASFAALQRLSSNEAGFGGDLRYGETGPGAGLRGADKICKEIAERSMSGAGKKKWRAFLSATAGADGKQVDAIDRIGDGPWYDRIGRVFALRKADLFHDRPSSADSVIAHDFPNEDGVPNQTPDGTEPVDNHDILTGTNERGELFSATSTCKDWTSALGDPETAGRPHVGHAWDRMLAGGTVLPPPGFDRDAGFVFMGEGPGDGGLPPRGGMMTFRGDGGLPPPGGPGMQGGGPDGRSPDNWMSALDEAGCAPGANLIQDGPPKLDNPTVGSGGGYGGIYCFALTP